MSRINRNKNEDEGRFWLMMIRFSVLVVVKSGFLIVESLCNLCWSQRPKSSTGGEQTSSIEATSTSTEAKSFVHNNLPTMSCQNFFSEDHLSVDKLLTVLTIESLQRGTNKTICSEYSCHWFQPPQHFWMVNVWGHANKVRHYWKQRYTRRLKQILTIFILRHSNPQN